MSTDHSYLPLIVVSALITYATRLAGLAFSDRRVPPVVRRFLAYVPIAAFAALVAPGLGHADDDLMPRLTAAAVAAIVGHRIRRLWACISVGLVVFWITRWAT
jgi:branched-subunit amino acid transport protein